MTSSTTTAPPESTGAEADARFRPLTRCWVCDGDRLERAAPLIFDFKIYARQDPELAAYTGAPLHLNRCQGCGFMQPAGMPTLDGFFSRMYDTRWSPEWVEGEFNGTYRDRIFRTVLAELRRRGGPGARTLLDVGAHVGRLVQLAADAGWDSSGIELNPTTASFAARKTGRTIHQQPAESLAVAGLQFDAVTILDVLEHIPEPVPMIAGLFRVLAPGGWLALKVPCGRSQLVKETWRSRLRPGYRINIADNLVHVNHFNPRALRHALERAGFVDVTITTGAPEEPPLRGASDVVGLASRWFRGAVYQAARTLPGGVESSLTMNLQAYARRPR